MGSEITYPGGHWDPLDRQLSTTLLDTLVIDVHTMVTTLSGCRNYFSQPGNPYSHFGLPADGPPSQWQDLRYRAASDLDGNSFCISIETEDTGSAFPDWQGSDVPAWTDRQVEELAKLIAWLCIRFGIPAVMLPDSLPGQTGGSVHRLGIDPYRVQGGVRYSKSYAKACPGDRRIAQMRDEVMPRAAQLLGGDDMPLSDTDLGKIEAIVARYTEQLKPLVIAGDEHPTNWYIENGVVKQEVDQNEARQRVAEGTARWWPGLTQALVIPQAQVDALPTIGPDDPDV